MRILLSALLAFALFIPLAQAGNFRSLSQAVAFAKKHPAQARLTAVLFCTEEANRRRLSGNTAFLKACFSHFPIDLSQDRSYEYSTPDRRTTDRLRGCVDGWGHRLTENCPEVCGCRK